MEGVIRQLRLHATNRTSLTRWKAKGEGHWSAHDCMRPIGRHLLPGSRRERSIRQPRLHATNRTSLTRWTAMERVIRQRQIACEELDVTYSLEVVGEVHSSAQIAGNESDVTYSLEGDGCASFVSAHCMRRIGRHLLPGWRFQGHSPRRLHKREGYSSVLSHRVFLSNLTSPMFSPPINP